MAYAAPLINDRQYDIQSPDNATEYDFGDNDDPSMIRTEDGDSDSDLESKENFSYGQDSIISDELKSNATDNSNSSNDNNSNDDDDHTPLKFVISPPKKFSNMEEKSIELYSLMLSKGVPRETYRVILSFFNDWISDEHFGMYKYI